MWVVWGNCLLFALQTENLTSLFKEIPFTSFYKVADSVTQQIRICLYKTQMATTGTRSPLVPSQYSCLYYAVGLKKKNNDFGLYFRYKGVRTPLTFSIFSAVDPLLPMPLTYNVTLYTYKQSGLLRHGAVVWGYR